MPCGFDMCIQYTKLSFRLNDGTTRNVAPSRNNNSYDSPCTSRGTAHHLIPSISLDESLLFSSERAACGSIVSKGLNQRMFISVDRKDEQKAKPGELLISQVAAQARHTFCCRGLSRHSCQTDLPLNSPPLNSVVSHKTARLRGAQLNSI